MSLPGIAQSGNLFADMQEKVRLAWANTDAKRFKLSPAEDSSIVSSTESLFDEIKATLPVFLHCPTGALTEIVCFLACGTDSSSA